MTAKEIRGTQLSVKANVGVNFLTERKLVHHFSYCSFVSYLKAVWYTHL